MSPKAFRRNFKYNRNASLLATGMLAYALMASAALAAMLHVAPNGDDATGDGTKEKPVADVYSMRADGGGASRGAQIDLLIDRKDGIVNLCEMKYAHGEYAITKEEHDKLQNRIAAFERIAGKNKSVHLTMVTTCGLAHNTYWNDVQSEVVLDDLFREAR